MSDESQATWKSTTKYQPPITVSVSVSRKVNLGNYESVDVFFSLSGVTVDATDDEIAEALETGEEVFEQIKTKVQEKVELATRNRGGD